MTEVMEQTGWFWENCRRQRKKPAKICLECPFIDYKTGKLKPELLIKAPNQDLPDMVFYCPTCGKMVKNTKCNIVEPEDGYVWMKVLSKLEFYPDLDENEPEDHTAEDAEYHWKRDKEEK